MHCIVLCKVSFSNCAAFWSFLAMKEKRVRSIFLRSISSTSELVGKCATRKPKLGFLWNFWCHSYFPLETAPRSAQFTPLLPLLREIIKAEWCQTVKSNVYVLKVRYNRKQIGAILPKNKQTNEQTNLFFLLFT